MKGIVSCVVAALLVLLAEQAFLIGAVRDPSWGWPPPWQIENTQRFYPGLSRPALAAGSWSALDRAWANRTPPPPDRRLAREGLALTRAIRNGYGTLLAPLDQAQRARALAPERRLVDPLFPGLGASPERIFTVVVAALARRAGAESVPGPAASTFRLDDPRAHPPCTLFWGLGREALIPDGGLSPRQCAQVLQALAALRSNVQSWHEVRGRLWFDAGQKPLLGPKSPGPPPFAFPDDQELDSAERLLGRLAP